jgi:hypothetical protein
MDPIAVMLMRFLIFLQCLPDDFQEKTGRAADTMRSVIKHVAKNRTAIAIVDATSMGEDIGKGLQACTDIEPGWYLSFYPLFGNRAGDRSPYDVDDKVGLSLTELGSRIEEFSASRPGGKPLSDDDKQLLLKCCAASVANDLDYCYSPNVDGRDAKCINSILKHYIRSADLAEEYRGLPANAPQRTNLALQIPPEPTAGRDNRRAPKDNDPRPHFLAPHPHVHNVFAFSRNNSNVSYIDQDLFPNLAVLTTWRGVRSGDPIGWHYGLLYWYHTPWGVEYKGTKRGGAGRPAKVGGISNLVDKTIKQKVNALINAQRREKEL